MKGDDSIEINLIGSNCSNGRRLKKIIERVSLENKTKIIINELNTKASKEKYNISMIPALVIDNRIISQGKILSVKEIKRLIVNPVNS